MAGRQAALQSFSQARRQHAWLPGEHLHPPLWMVKKATQERGERGKKSHLIIACLCWLIRVDAIEETIKCFSRGPISTPPPRTHASRSIQGRGPSARGMSCVLIKRDSSSWETHCPSNPSRKGVLMPHSLPTVAPGGRSLDPAAPERHCFLTQDAEGFCQTLLTHPCKTPMPFAQGSCVPASPRACF